MTKLQLPITIRTPLVDEIPMDQEVIEKIENARTANLVEGYKLLTEVDDAEPFEFYAEINVDNDRLWTLLKRLVDLLPEEVALVFGHIDHEPLFSAYLEKDRILNCIENYKLELSKDPFLEFGILHYDEVSLNEVFVKKPKYLQFWGTNKTNFIDIMNEFGLEEVPSINFIDEFPMVSESLPQHEPNALSTEEVLLKLSSNLGS